MSRRMVRHQRPLFSSLFDTDVDFPGLDLNVWPFLLNLVEDRDQDVAPQPAETQEQWQGRNVCKVMRNPLDLVYTVVEIRDNTYCISMPLGKDFKTENLDVKIKDHQAIIQVKTEQESQDGTSHLSQVYTKKIPIPEEAKLGELKSHLTHDGVLKIRIPLPAPEPVQQQAMDIPIAVDVDDTAAPA